MLGGVTRKKKLGVVGGGCFGEVEGVREEREERFEVMIDK